MKPLKQLRNRILTLASKASYRISPPKQRYFLHQQIPYFCQWESRELVTQILSGKMETEADPKWQASGASTPEEYATWSWNVCGMTCLKMILAATTGKVFPLTPLAKRCAEYDGYIVRTDRIDGLYYKPFVLFVKKEFGLTATVKPVLTLEDIITALSQEKFVIASVSPDIRTPASQPRTTGGHLILLLGYDLDKQLLYLHNPSGTTVTSQEYAEVTFTQFQKFFDQKGITVQR